MRTADVCIMSSLTAVRSEPRSVISSGNALSAPQWRYRCACHKDMLPMIGLFLFIHHPFARVSADHIPRCGKAVASVVYVGDAWISSPNPVVLCVSTTRFKLPLPRSVSFLMCAPWFIVLHPPKEPALLCKRTEVYCCRFSHVLHVSNSSYLLSSDATRESIVTSSWIVCVHVLLS